MSDTNKDRNADGKFELLPELKVSFIIPRVPQNILTNYYIPLLKKEGHDEEKINAILQLTQGSFSSQIDIVDEELNVIDVLPPLIEGQALGVNFNKLLSDIKLKDEHMPGSGEALGKQVLQPVTTDITTHIQDAWMPILHKYDKGDVLEEPVRDDDEDDDVLDY